MLTHRIKTTLLVKAGTKEKAEEKLRKVLRAGHIHLAEIEFEKYADVDN